MTTPFLLLHPAAALGAVAMAAALVSATAHGRDPGARGTASVPDPVQLERRLQSLKALVEGSSAARQIEASGNVLAAGQRNEARQLVRLAEEAHAARDERSAASLLDGAARQMLEGTRLASGGRAGSADLERDVGSRIEAAQALLAAQRRISAEKGEGAETARRIDRLLEEARGLAAARRFADAQPLARQAYLLAKASIGSMRSGDTLVRRLSFASKEEEYHYEIDRYDTHRMLLDLLVKRQGSGDAVGGAFVARAGELRKQAEASAGRGDHAAAIGLMEDATRELVRAIRGAGVFIPG